jgi:hypothetical protein
MPQKFDVVIKATLTSAEGTDVDETNDIIDTINDEFDNTDLVIDVDVDDDDSDESIDSVSFKLEINDVEVTETS